MSRTAHLGPTALGALLFATGCSPGVSLGGDVLPAERIVAWSRAGVPGGIPHRTVVCDRALTTASTKSDIQAALDECPSDTVVLLPEGIYELDSTDGLGLLIRRDQITLRGAGPDKTVLRFHGLVSLPGALVHITKDPDPLPHALSMGNVAHWVGPFTRGTTELTLDATPASLVAGTVLNLDQVADGALVTMGPAPCGSCGRDATRMLQQTVLVTSVRGTTIAFDPPLYSGYWSAAQMPEVWWQPHDDIVRESGIEDLKLDGTGSGEANVKLTGTYGCWMRNVDSYGAMHYNVFAWYSKNIEIRDSYLHDTTNIGIDAFAIDLYHSLSDALVVNNIIKGWTTSVNVTGSQGDVIAYNYGLDHPTATTSLPESAMTRGGHPHYVLFESNVWPDIGHDDGSSSHDVDFRNALSGWEPGTAATMQLWPVHVEAHNDAISFLGNVLGTTAHTVAGTVTIDPTCTGMLLHGNVDATTDPPSVLGWEPSLGSHQLAASLFLTARPRWWVTPWGAPSWPAIGPDPDTPTLIHREAIPAELCYEQTLAATPSDATNHTYDARRCYGTGG